MHIKLTVKRSPGSDSKAGKPPLAPKGEKHETTNFDDLDIHVDDQQSGQYPLHVVSDITSDHSSRYNKLSMSDQRLCFSLLR